MRPPVMLGISGGRIFMLFYPYSEAIRGLDGSLLPLLLYIQPGAAELLPAFPEYKNISDSVYKRG